VILGIQQSVTSLLTFVGLHKIGTSRSQPLRNTYPLWSALIAIVIMHERASAMIVAGTLLIVVGVVLISWKPDVPPLDIVGGISLFPCCGCFGGCRIPALTLRTDDH
jgi:drug/metabolite transporter (DMT)-like permease